MTIKNSMSNKGMSFYHVNTRSLYSKLQQLEILYNEADILCCTETWLDNRFSNDCIYLNNKKVFRYDRKSNVRSLNARPTAGGVCIYVDNSWSNYSTRIDECTSVNSDFEILTLVTSRPSHRFFVTICVYKQPKGNLSKCIDFLNEILNHKILQKKEIWILGDFNTDLHKRDNSMTVLLHRFTKKWDLKHLVNQTTRPNNSGGTCIDLIMSNSPFISNHGVCNDMIAEHFTVFAIRKKTKGEL